MESKNAKREYQTVSGIRVPNVTYDLDISFDELSKKYQPFAKFIIKTKNEGFTIDWENLEAVRQLNIAILKVYFGISMELPDHFLIPTIISRANYIKWIAKLINYEENDSKNDIHGIDMYSSF